MTYDALGRVIDRLREEGLVAEREGLVEASPRQRLGIAVRAVEAGADLERVGRALGWQEFEEMTAHIFEENGFAVRRRLRYRARGRRWEIDVLASRRPLVVCTECKRWTRGMSGSAAAATAEAHLDRTRALCESLVALAGRLGLGGWTRARVVPVALSLTPAPFRVHGRFPIVPVLELPSFLAELEGHLDLLSSFSVELPPSRPRPVQTILRGR